MKLLLLSVSLMCILNSGPITIGGTLHGPADEKLWKNARIGFFPIEKGKFQLKDGLLTYTGARTVTLKPLSMAGIEAFNARGTKFTVAVPPLKDGEYYVFGFDTSAKNNSITFVRSSRQPFTTSITIEEKRFIIERMQVVSGKIYLDLISYELEKDEAVEYMNIMQSKGFDVKVKPFFDGRITVMTTFRVLIDGYEDQFIIER
jgi:hypothetical protein